MTSTNATKLLTAEEVADYYGVTSRCIRNKANSLNRNGVKVGSQIAGLNLWLFSEDELPLLVPLPVGRPRKNT